LDSKRFRVAQKNFVPNLLGFANLAGFYRGQNFSGRVWTTILSNPIEFAMAKVVLSNDL
jgi:hypothetical protein